MSVAENLHDASIGPRRVTRHHHVCVIGAPRLSDLDVIDDIDYSGDRGDVVFGGGSLLLVPDTAGERELPVGDLHMEVLGMDAGVGAQPL